MPFRYAVNTNVHSFALAPTGDYTVEMWAVFYATTTGASPLSMFWMGDNGPYSGTIYENGVWMGLLDYGSGNTLDIWTRDSTVGRCPVPVGNLPLGVPIHIAFTGNTGTGQNLQFFLNGNLMATGTSGSAGTYLNEIVYIGNDPQLSTTPPDTNFSAGVISDVVLSNTIKTQAQIRAGMRNFDVAKVGAWGAWKLRDSSGPLGTTDQSGNGRDLTATGPPTVDAWMMPNTSNVQNFRKNDFARRMVSWQRRRKATSIAKMTDVRAWW